MSAVLLTITYTHAVGDVLAADGAGWSQGKSSYYLRTRFSPSLPLLKELHWLPVIHRIKCILATVTFFYSTTDTLN